MTNDDQSWTHFLSLAQSKLRLCSANHRPGYWSNLPSDWPSTAWAYSEQETENRPWCFIHWWAGSQPMRDDLCMMTYARNYLGCETNYNSHVFFLFSHLYPPQFPPVWPWELLSLPPGDGGFHVLVRQSYVHAPHGTEPGSANQSTACIGLKKKVFGKNFVQTDSISISTNSKFSAVLL